MKNRSQVRIVAWIAAIAVASGVSAVWIGNSGFAFAALLSVMLVALALVSRGFAEHEPNSSPAEYFGASSHLTSLTTLQSLGSSWVMLGNVVVAGMILGQLFGLYTSWMVVTWALAFVLMSHRVGRVRDVLGAEDTLHSFLHRTYGSIAMRRVAAMITAFVGFGVFSIELIAGIALLLPVFPPAIGPVVAPLLVLLLVTGMCLAAISGGLRAVIKTDSMLWPVVIAGVVVLLLFTGDLVGGQGLSAFSAKLALPKLDGWGLTAFFVGLAALQIPLLLGDYGTWQRIKATKAEEKKSLASHTLRQAGWQAFLWGVPVVAGIALLGLPATFANEGGNLYPSSYPLIEIVHHWVITNDIPLVARVVVVTIFLVGMLAVMVSTANTYLLIAMETWVRDFRPRKIDEFYPTEEAIGRRAVVDARILCVFLGLIACLPVAILVQFKFNLVGLILIVFSAQVALAPAAVLALFFEDVAPLMSRAVIKSTLGAFVASITYGLYTNYAATGWLKDYGPFLSAAVALIIPTVTITVQLAFRNGPRASFRFLGKLLWPFK